MTLLKKFLMRLLVCEMPSSFGVVTVINIVCHVNSDSALFLGRQCFREAFDMKGIKGDSKNKMFCSPSI